MAQRTSIAAQTALKLAKAAKSSRLMFENIPGPPGWRPAEGAEETRAPPLRISAALCDLCNLGVNIHGHGATDI